MDIDFHKVSIILIKFMWRRRFEGGEVGEMVIGDLFPKTSIKEKKKQMKEKWKEKEL